MTAAQSHRLNTGPGIGAWLRITRCDTFPGWIGEKVRLCYPCDEDSHDVAVVPSSRMLKDMRTVYEKDKETYSQPLSEVLWIKVAWVEPILSHSLFATAMRWLKEGLGLQ